MQSGGQGRVNCELSAPKTTGISGIGCRQVHVTDHHVGCDSCPSFATNPCCCAFHREPSSSQDPCPCASCSVVTTGIEWTATPAEARGQWQRKTQTSQQQNTEQSGVNASERTGRTSLQRCSSSRTTLRPEQSPLWFCHHSEQGFPVFLFDPWRKLRAATLSGTLLGREEDGSQCPFETAHALQTVCCISNCPQTVSS